LMSNDLIKLLLVSQKLATANFSRPDS